MHQAAPQAVHHPIHHRVEGLRHPEIETGEFVPKSGKIKSGRDRAARNAGRKVVKCRGKTCFSLAALIGGGK